MLIIPNKEYMFLQLVMVKEMDVTKMHCIKATTICGSSVKAWAIF